MEDAAKKVLTSPETIDKGAEIIAASAQKKGFKVDKETVGAAEIKKVVNQVQAAVPGSNAVQSPTYQKV